jgi:hypothetical protein
MMMMMMMMMMRLILHSLCNVVVGALHWVFREYIFGHPSMAAIIGGGWGGGPWLYLNRALCRQVMHTHSVHINDMQITILINLLQFNNRTRMKCRSASIVIPSNMHALRGQLPAVRFEVVDPWSSLSPDSDSMVLHSTTPYSSAPVLWTTDGQLSCFVLA